MRAAVCAEYGPPSKVAVVNVDDPTPASGQAVVDVRAAAVNFADVLMVKDAYQNHVPVPFTPGSEFAGVVRAIGDGAGLEPGTRVMGVTPHGAFAEQVAVAATGLTPLPDGVGFAEAAGFSVAHTTAYHSLRSVARVEPGEFVVVLGAAGGVGLAAVELGSVLGAKVVAAASTDEKLEVCRQRGAVAGINYETEDLKTRIRALTDGGAHVVVDPVGGRYAEPALRACRFGGRFVTVGFASGDIPRIPLNLVLLKGVVVVGFEIWNFLTYLPDEARRNTTELLGLLASGRVRPHVSTVLPLDRVVEALEIVASRQATGKVVLEVGA